MKGLFLLIALLSIVILVVGAKWSFGLDYRDLAICAQIKNDVERLQCFDNLSKGAGLHKPKTVITGSGKWNVRKEISPIDDSVNVFLMLEAEADISGWPQNTFRPTLAIRCKEKNIGAYIITGMAAHVDGQPGQAKVTLRFDRKDAKTIRMSESTDNKALFFQHPKGWVSQMEDAETLLFQFTPFNSSQTLTTFDLKGLKEALIPLKEACEW
jgi:type VI secretion system protein VasI